MIAGVADGLAALGPGASAIWVCAALSDADRAVAPGGWTRATATASRCGCSTSPPRHFHRAYNGVANSTLWFVHHLLYDTPNQPVFDAVSFRREWESYLAYNGAFADALARPRRPTRRGGRACWSRTTT